MKQSGLALLVRDERLASALQRSLRDLVHAPSVTLDRMDELEAATVILTTTTDCSPSIAGGLAERGLRVVALAALPNAAQKERYERMGATAYLPMEVHGGALHQLLSTLLSPAGDEASPRESCPGSPPS